MKSGLEPSRKLRSVLAMAFELVGLLSFVLWIMFKSEQVKSERCFCPNLLSNIVRGSRWLFCPFVCLI
jgi:hypothetical protein